MTKEVPPTTAPLDETLVEALADVDERLRNGEPLESIEISVGLAHSGEAKELFACLQLLERTYSRADRKPDPGAAIPQYLGRFALLKVLGQGGFGVVYLARDPMLGRQIALKVPRLHTLSNPALNERFLREARAVAALDHPHILPILEAGEIGPVCYIASAYCEEGDLASWIKTHAPIAPRVAAKIMATLADATHYSHSKGILHRDLKPSNVLMATRTSTVTTAGHDLPFTLRLTDFGLARLTEEGLGETGSTILGTPTYMAPEQACGSNDRVSSATDVYALGVMLYELLTGRPPFLGAGFVDVIDQIRNDEPIAPSRLVRSIPRDLETICLHSLKKDPATRYATASELRDDLQRFLRHEPVRAKPASLWVRARKWGTRHPALMVSSLVSAVAITVLFVGLMAHLWQVGEHLNVTEKLRIAGKKREEKLRAQVYGAELEAAAAEVFAGLPHLAQQRLSQFIPEKAEDGLTTDVRGPEWHYLNQLSQPTLPVNSFNGHGAAVYSVAIHPDGKLVASGDRQGVVKVWSTVTGQEVTSMKSHSGEVRGLEFTPDGAFLAAAGSFDVIKVWSVSDWNLVSEFTAHAGTTTSIDVSPDGKSILSSGRDGYVSAWDWRSGEELWSSKVKDVAQVARFVGDARRFYAMCDTTLTIPARTDQTESLNVYEDHQLISKDRVLAMDASADGNIVVGGGYGNEIVLFDRRTLQQSMLSIGQSLHAAAFRDAGRAAALGGSAGSIFYLQFETDSIGAVKFHRWRAHDDHVEDLKFSADGKQIVSASIDGTVRTWNLSDIPPAEVTLLVEPTQRSRQVVSRSLAVIGSRLAIAGEIETGDGFVHTWDPANLLDNRFIDCPQYPVDAIRSVPGSQRLVGASINRALLLWDDVSTAGTPRVIENSKIHDIALSPDGQTVAVAEYEREPGLTVVRLHSAITGQTIKELYSDPDSPGGMAFSPDGLTLVVGFDGTPMRFINLRTGSIELAKNLGHGTGSVRFNHTGTLLAATSGGGHFPGTGTGKHTFLIDARTREVTSAFYLGSWFSTKRVFALSSDGRLLAASVVENGGEIVVWHLPTGRVILRLTPFGTLPVHLEFMEGGKYLAATTEQPASRKLRPSPNTFIWKLAPETEDGLAPPVADNVLSPAP